MGPLLKFTRTDGTPCHGGSGAWPLPTDNGDGTWTPGDWREVDGDLEPCQNGLHVCIIRQALDHRWLGPAAWLAEVDGEVIVNHDKTVARRARLVRRLTWDRTIAVTFAADCAERVLPLFESRYPDDNRPRRAIEAARTWAANPTAAYDAYYAGYAGYAADAAAAAYAAGYVAAYAAANAAANAANAAAYATDAAYYAGHGAAYAADAADATAVVVVERKWQAERLTELLGLEVAP